MLQRGRFAHAQHNTHSKAFKAVIVCVWRGVAPGRHSDEALRVRLIALHCGHATVGPQVRIARVDGELEDGLRSHYPTMVESDGRLYVVYSKFYHEVIDANRTDLGIHLVEVRHALRQRARRAARLA